MGLVTSIDLKSEQKQLIKHYLGTLLPRTQVWAYGSRVKWTARPASDLDVVIFSQPAQKRQVSKLKEMLEESNLPFKVDIFVWEQVPENFIPSIKEAYYVLQETDENKEGVTWPLVKLGDHIDSCLGKMLDKNKNKGEYSPYLGNSNVRWGYFELDNLSDMKFESYEHERYGIKKGDLIVCEGGEPGRCAIWDCDIPGMKIQKNLHRIRPLEGLDSEYLYYWFLNSGKTGRLEPFFTGTIIKHLTGKALAQLPIEIPPLEHQKYCANILRSLDKKIELNKQTNQTLEQMAQTLFKSWFVDFDPVFDNLLATVDFKLENFASDFPEALLKRAEKRLLALDDNAKAALLSDKEPSADLHQHFPSEFEHNKQLGWIPKDWSLKSIDALCDINPQSWTKKNAPEVVNYIDLANAKNGSVGEVIEYKFSEAPSQARRVLQLHDTIIGVVRPANRSFAYVNETGLTGSTGFVVVRAINKNYRVFSYLSLTNDDCIQEFTRIADGAAYPAIKPEDVAKVSCVFSNDIILEKFEELVSELMNKIAVNERQSEYLTKLRDTLLPKLISGELQIPTALETTENSTAALGTNDE